MTLYRDGAAVARTDSEGGAVEQIVVDPSGARAVSRSQDGGVRVWSASTGDLLAELVDFADGEWAVVTPGGAYSGTPEVGARFGWVFPSPLEYFGFESLPSVQLTRRGRTQPRRGLFRRRGSRHPSPSRRHPRCPASPRRRRDGIAARAHGSFCASRARVRRRARRGLARARERW